MEGAEGAVLKGLVSSGAIRNIDQIIVDYDHHDKESSNKFGEFLSQLEESGFGWHCTKIRVSGVNLVQTGILNQNCAGKVP